MASLFDSVKDGFYTVADGVSAFVTDFWQNRKPVFIAICALILLIVILLIFLCFSIDSPEPVYSAAGKAEVTDFVYFPDIPEIPDEYGTDRQTPDHWSEADVEKWFSEPDDSMLRSLSNANTLRIQKLLEAAP